MRAPSVYVHTVHKTVDAYEAEIIVALESPRGPVYRACLALLREDPFQLSRRPGRHRLAASGSDLTAWADDALIDTLDEAEELGCARHALISEIVEVIDAAADDPPVPQGWSVYHACYASHPELHRDGDWYYQPEGFEGPEAFSPGYQSRSEALFACLGYQHEREAWLAALDEAHEHLDADLHHEN